MVTEFCKYTFFKKGLLIPALDNLIWSYHFIYYLYMDDFQICLVLTSPPLWTTDLYIQLYVPKRYLELW